MASNQHNNATRAIEWDISVLTSVPPTISNIDAILNPPQLIDESDPHAVTADAAVTRVMNLGIRQINTGTPMATNSTTVQNPTIIIQMTGPVEGCLGKIADLFRETLRQHLSGGGLASDVMVDFELEDWRDEESTYAFAWIKVTI